MPLSGWPVSLRGQPRPLRGSKKPGLGSERPWPGSERAGPASERPEPASEGHGPAPKRPGLASEGPMGGMDGRTDVRTDVQIPPVFYRTLSAPVPSEAAAQKVALLMIKNANSLLLGGKLNMKMLSFLNR